MQHAETRIERVQLLEGTPEIARCDILRAGTGVKEPFDNDRRFERKGVAHYR